MKDWLFLKVGLGSSGLGRARWGGTECQEALEALEGSEWIGGHEAETAEHRLQIAVSAASSDTSLPVVVERLGAAGWRVMLAQGDNGVEVGVERVLQLAHGNVRSPGGAAETPALGLSPAAELGSKASMFSGALEPTPF